MVDCQSACAAYRLVKKSKRCQQPRDCLTHPTPKTTFKDLTTPRGAWQAISLPTYFYPVLTPGGTASTYRPNRSKQQSCNLSNESSYRSSAAKALPAPLYLRALFSLSVSVSAVIFFPASRTGTQIE